MATKANDAEGPSVTSSYIYGPGGYWVQTSAGGGLQGPGSQIKWVAYPPGPHPTLAPAQPSKELVGGKNFVLLHNEANNTSPLSDGTPFTVTTFDTTTRGDSAKILLNNGSASEMVELAACIKGNAVWRLSGTGGYIHDKYVNYESIAVDGDRLFQLGNNMVCTLAQVNKLADIHW
jgi:hypothetical protein